MTTMVLSDLAEPRILPRITAKFAFYQLAKAREVDVSNFEKACLFDVALRKEGVGFVSNADLRFWYSRLAR